jgi:hypothetical protein
VHLKSRSEKKKMTQKPWSFVLPSVMLRVEYGDPQDAFCVAGSASQRSQIDGTLGALTTLGGWSSRHSLRSWFLDSYLAI